MVQPICQICSKNPCKWSSETIDECPGYREKDVIQSE